LVALALVACDDDDKGDPTATASPVVTATAAATPLPQPPDDLASQIGPRAELPHNDPIALAARYGETQGRAPAFKPFAGEPNVGDSREFIVVRVSGSATGPPPVATHVATTLAAKTAHAYFYVDTSLGANPSSVQSSADVFENETWPATTGVFGLPPSPGVDSDPHLVVLIGELGGVGGYHSSDDLYLRAVRPLSNESEMVYMDASLAPGSATFDVVLAHELQHLIHAENDESEEAWVNEGLSVTAEGIAGGAMSVIDSFEERPFTQLNRWEFESNLPHYGAGGAFFGYLAARFGGEHELGAIAAADADGPAGIDEFLAATGDPQRRFRAVFADWVAANILNRAEGPYANPRRPLDISIDRELSVGDTVDSEAVQFGTDYYEVSGVGAGVYALRFNGAEEVDVLPASPADSPRAVYWGNSSDGIDTTLTCDVDLTNQTAAELRFDAWYDIEPYYDRGYVSVSTDNGTNWRALTSTSSNTHDPVEVYLGPGFDGRSGDPLEPEWIAESVDLTEFAGQQIKLRFEYVTDGATHGEGWAIRDNLLVDIGSQGILISLDQCASDGWVRLDRALPQSYIVRLIGERADGEPVVIDATLDAQNDGELRFNGEGLTRLVLAVAGATEGTNQRAPYTIELQRAE
jgi:hypothetical protein